MGLKEYYKKKKEAINQYAEKREKKRMVSAEHKAEQLEVKAAKAEQLGKSLRRQEKARKTIQSTRKLKEKVSPSFATRLSSGMDNLSKSLPKSSSSGGMGFGGDIFNSSHLGMDISGVKKPSTTKRKKRRKSKGKTITIRMG